MDAEEARRLLTEVRLRCRILEADKEVESLRAAKYCNILDTLASEDSSGATQPEASRVLHATGSVLERPTLPVASSSSGPEVLTIARRYSADPPMVGRKRGSSTADSSAQISKRARLTLNISGASTSTSEPRSPGMLVSTDANARVLNVAGILRNTGLTSLELTRAEATRVEETPGIGWAMFSKLFGGPRRSEWPRSSRFPGYSDFFCADVIVQPFAPHAAGKPGLLLRLPTVIETPETGKSTIHVLSNTLQGDTLYYRGKYTRVPVPEIHFHWFDLPYNFRDRWTKRISNPAARTPAIRALRARIDFRNKRRREPSTMEVRAHLQCFNDQVTYKEVAAAFRAGEEKMVLEGLRCTGYDSYLAMIIQGTVEANED